VLGTQEKYQINNPGRMAELTSRMVNACFRKGPRSWTAALSALEFFGFTPAAFVSDRPGGAKVKSCSFANESAPAFPLLCARPSATRAGTDPAVRQSCATPKVPRVSLLPLTMLLFRVGAESAAAAAAAAAAGGQSGRDEPLPCG
jgi:hypothetical protein